MEYLKVTNEAMDALKLSFQRVSSGPPLRTTKQNEKDCRRIFGPAIRAGREPNDEELAEVMMLKIVRDQLAAGKFTMAGLRGQFGGLDRERTIRKAAKALAFYHAQIKIIERDGSLALTVPDGMRETFAALKSQRDEHVHHDD